MAISLSYQLDVYAWIAKQVFVCGDQSSFMSPGRGSEERVRHVISRGPRNQTQVFERGVGLPIHRCMFRRRTRLKGVQETP